MRNLLHICALLVALTACSTQLIDTVDEVDPPARTDNGIRLGAQAMDHTPAQPADDRGDPQPSIAIDCEDPSDCSSGALEVALLWVPHALESGEPRFEPSGLCPEGSNLAYGGQVAQPIVVDVALPLQIDISMLAPPPEHALAKAEGHDGGWTVAHLVLYRDGNGNGLLDPRNLEQSSPDEILGTSGDWGLQFGPTPGVTSYVVYYSDETLSEYGPVVEAGYNVFRDVADAITSSGERTPMPLDTPIPVPVRVAPKVQTLNCEELCFAEDSEFSCPASMAELPDDGSFDCYTSASLWWRTRCEGCFCFTAVCSYEGEPCPAE